MTHKAPFFISSRGLLLVLAVIVGWPRGASAEAAADPVEQLREMLKQGAFPLDERKRELTKQTETLHSLADVRRALLLHEWRDQDPEATIANVDAAVRAGLLRRFEGLLRQGLKKPDANTRIATLKMLGETGFAIRVTDHKYGLARSFAPDVAQLVTQGQPDVCEAAARTLGLIYPDPAVAVPVLQGLLRSDTASHRIAASEGLLNLMQSLVGSRGSGPFFAGVEWSLADLTDATKAVVPVAASALTDREAAVRRRSAETLAEAALGLLQAIPEAERREDIQELKPAEMAKEEQAFRASLKLLQSVLKDQVRAVNHSAVDEDVRVSLAACKALETLAEARLRHLHRAANVARLVAPVVALPPAEDLLREELRTAAPILAKRLTHSDVRIRLAALYVLETLESEAAPAAAAVVKALQDENSFVRWGAVRTLGRMAPAEADAAVPELAKRLEDDNADVRLTAAAALERFGPKARAAVPALTKAVGRGEAEMRVRVCGAIGAIGPEAKAATPGLLTALTSAEVEVRRAAARALGRLGSPDPTAAEALRKALDDSDSEVRQAAADALLSGK